MTELFQALPDDWHVKALGDICNIDPEMLSSAIDPNYTFRYIDIASVGPNKVSDDLAFEVFRSAPSRARKRVKKDDVLMSTVRPNLKSFAKVSLEGELVASTGFAVLRAVKGKSHPEFLKQVLFSEEIERQVESLVAGSNYPAITVGNVRRLRVAVPPYTEQRGIAEVLSALDEQIEATEVLVAKSKLRSKGLMADLLSCRLLHPQDVNDVLLSDAVPDVQYGISSSLDVVGVIPVLRMNNLSGGEISVSDLKYSPSSVSSNLLLHPGDVLFNRTNSMEHVGRTSIWRGQLAEATFASYLVRLKLDLRKLMPEYLVYLLEWDVHQLQMRKFATPGVQQVNINPTSLRRCRVCIPKSLAVQRDVVDALDSAREHVSGLRAEAAKLRLQKQGLMRDLLSGKVRVH